jgi:surface antigen
MKKGLILLGVIVLMGVFGVTAFFRSETIQTSVGKVINNYEVGDTVDSFNEVPVYYNGAVSHTGKRHLSENGYNYGLSYQCVEFVKRYYYDYLNHKMPNTYGNAKDFFDVKLKDGQLNKDRNLVQYNNGSKTLPQVNDLLVFGAVTFNKYGHVAIVSKVDSTEIEMIQQNPGPTAPSRVTYKVEKKNGKWFIDRSDLLGWLRKE